MSVRAVILVGGAGTRLRPLTLNTPKPLVPVCNAPVLQRLLEHLRSHRIMEITLAIESHGRQLCEAFGTGESLGVNIRYVQETRPLGSGGAIANAARGWTEPFLVLNGDIVTDIDLTDFMAAHQAQRAAVSIALHGVPDPSPYGVVGLAPAGRIEQFVEKPTIEQAPSRLINAGIWMLDPSALVDLDPDRFHRIEETLFPQLASECGPIFGYEHDGYWADVGTLPTYRDANFDLLSRIGSGDLAQGASIVPGASLLGRVLIGAGSVIHADCVIRGPAVIGRDCVIAPGARVESSILWDDVQISSGASLNGSVLASGTRVGPRAEVRSSALQAHTTVAEGARSPAEASLTSLGGRL